jgi:cytosine/adenosine deaminase-related metal-dependent hydrolase
MLDLLIKEAKLNGRLTDIGITDGHISCVLENIEEAALSVINAKGRIVVPGFIDCHMHLDKVLLNEESVYVDGTGVEKGALTFERKKMFTVENITERAELIIKRAISAGTLAIRTNVDVDASVGLKGIEALIQLREKYRGIITLQVVAFAQEGVFFDHETQVLLGQAIQMGADMIGGHSTAKGEGEKHIDFILNLAQKYNIEADFHLDESGNRNHYLLPYLAKRMNELGLVGRVNAIHCCTLSSLNQDELEEALSLIETSQLKITVAPTAISTRNLAPVKRLIEKNITVGLGSDNIRDFFNPLGSGDIKQAALLLSYVQRFFSEDEVNQVWSMVTDSGASLLGLPNFKIEKNNVANLTILDAYSPKEVIAYTSPAVVIIRSGKLIQDTLRHFII